MNMISIEEFIAFSLDFEGSLSIRKHQKKSGACTFQPDVKITNTSKQLLMEFMARVKFGMISEEIYVNEAASAYVWRLNIQEIRIYVPKIEPYLVTKREQARLIIEACSILKTQKETSRKGYKGKLLMSEMYTEDEYRRLIEIFYHMRELNEKPKYQMKLLTDAEKLLREFRKRGV